MHPIHQMRTHNGADQQHQDQHQNSLARAQQNRKSHHNHHQQQGQPQHQRQEHTDNMTVLQRLDPLLAPSQQPVLSSLDPVQQHQAQQQQVQNIMPPLASQLHQMQPSRQLPMSEQQQHQQDEHGHEQQEQAEAEGRRGHSGRSAHLERYITDGANQIAKWLLENYETADGDSLPRSTVYNHYMAHCKHMNVAAVNAASFGKIIRMVFVSLKTRRLGTRGHSKYHYFGIRAKPHVRLSEWLTQSSGEGGAPASGLLRDANDNSNGTENASESDSAGEGQRSCSMMSASGHNNNIKRLRRTNDGEPPSQMYASAQYHRLDQHQDSLEPVNQAYGQHGQQQPQHLEQHHMEPAYYPHAPVNGFDSKQGAPTFHVQPHNLDREHQFEHYDLSAFRSHFGANKATLVEEHWPRREADLLDRVGATKADRGLTRELADTFESQYKSHYTRVVELLGELQLGEIEHLLMDFWHPAPVPAAHETIHWTSSNTNEPRGHCEGPNANSDDGHYQHQGHHHHLIEQHQIDSQQMMYQMTNLTFEDLYRVTSHTAMIERIDRIDCALYSAIESFLIVDVLNPSLRPLLQHLRSFGRDLCSWMQNAVKEYQADFVNKKMASTKAFGLALRRSNSINYLALASRSIWSQRASLHQISEDISRLDLHDIDLQVSSLLNGHERLIPDINERNQHDHQRHSMWARRKCPELVQQADGNNKEDQPDYVPNLSNANDSNGYYNAPDNLNLESSEVVGCDARGARESLQPGQIMQSFVQLLEDPDPSTAWPDWCRSLIKSHVRGESSEAAREFILKWNYSISMVSRELALRSAPSLGSFQLIKLLFDEFMYHTVVKVQASRSMQESNVQVR